VTLAAASIEDYRWLVSSLAAPWLETASKLPDELHRRLAVMRRDLPAERAHLVLAQIELRCRASRKFTLASQLFFTSANLEQATDEHVAAYKVGRFPAGKNLADLCCGVGGDLMALARRGPTLAVDRDEVSAILAAANLAVAQVAGQTAVSGEAAHPAKLVCEPVAPAHVAACEAWHIDPDRRPAGRRTTRVELHEPGSATIESLLAVRENGAIKLAPAATLPASWPDRAELEWISRGRECRQLVAWFGQLARAPGQRRATVLGGGGPLRTIVGKPSASWELPAAAAVGRYLFEPDPAVLAAHLEGVLAAEHGLSTISPQPSYLTGDRLIEDAALAAFEITEVVPLRARALRPLLRARRIGRLEIKQRSGGQDLDKLRASLELSGDESATLLIAPAGDKLTAFLARRVNAAPSASS
jgi:hypothetical protein